MSIFKNPESCPNCVHKDVCMYKKDYAKFVADLEKIISFYLLEWILSNRWLLLVNTIAVFQFQ